MGNVEKKLECKEKSKQQEDLEIIANSNIDFEKYNRKTVFITGATGLVGSGLVKAFLCVNRLKGLEINIVAAVRNESRNLVWRFAEKKRIGIVRR